MEGEEQRSEDSRSFSSASIPKRIAIVAAGAIVNIIFGLVVYFILMASVGPYATNEIDTVIDGYAAQEIGLQNGDKIVEINSKKIETKSDLNKILETSNGEEINLRIERNNQTLEYNVKPTQVKSEDGKISAYFLGVNLRQSEDTFANRCIYGWMETKEFSVSIVDNLKQLFTGHVGVDRMIGPVGISEVVSKTNGIREFVYMLALISLSLGVTNLLPIPALDGGKILLLIIEAIRRKPFKEKTEINIQLIGFSILIALSLYISWNDVFRLFGQ